MLKQAVSLEVKKNDKNFQLSFPVESSLGELHDVLYQMRSFIVEKNNEAVKADIPKEPESIKEG